jgi:hypothetical protein
MIASVHPMLFRETYREVFAQKWLAPDEPTSNIAQMLRIFSESCIAFHKLYNKYKIAKNGVRSRELWPKYRRAATWVTG